MFEKIGKNVTLVFISSHCECGLLISEGKIIADRTNTKLNVINVQQKSEWGKKFSRELDNMLMISNNLDVQMLVFFSDNPIKILNDYIERNNVKHIVLGNDGLKTIDSDEQLFLESQKIELHLCNNK